jgi:ATP-dependent DNA ligase
LYVEDTDTFDKAMAKFPVDHPDAEGVVIRALYGDKSHFKAAWRSPGMLKLKVTETIDLPIHSFEEAVDKDGNKKGMVGRINVQYHTGASSDGNNEYTDFKLIGIGPGKLKHEERIELWKNQKAYVGRMIEIAYMPDPSYDALREPRFYRFRPDKD